MKDVPLYRPARRELIILLVAVLFALVIVTTAPRYSSASQYHAEGTPSVRIVAAGPVAPGDIVRVDVRAEGVSNLLGYEMALLYDSGLLRFLRVEHGQWVGSGAPDAVRVSAPVDADGVVSNILASRSDGVGVSGSGVLFSAYFVAEQVGTATFGVPVLFLADASTQPYTPEWVANPLVILPPEQRIRT